MTAVDPITVELSSAPITVTVASTGLVLSVASGTVGPAGAQGPAGAAGATGATGATGPAGQGVPVGGSTGQVLSKVSGTDYDTTWSTVSGGGGAPAAHAASHQDGGSDELALDASQITSGTMSIYRLADAGFPADSTYLNGLSDLNRPTAVWNRVTFSNADYTITSPFSVLVAQTGTLSATRTVTLPGLFDFTFLHPGTTLAQQVLIWSGAGVSPAKKLVVAAASGETINGAATFEITEANRLVTINSNRASSPTATNPSWIVEPGPTPWRVITDTTLAAAAASFSVTVTGCTDLEVMLSGLSDSTAAASIGVRMRFNNDSGSNYLNNNGAATTAWNSIGSMPSSLTNTDRNGLWLGRISLGGVGRYTAAAYQNALVTSTATTGLAQSSSSGSAYYINTTAAIDTLLIYPSADNWEAGTRLLVRGK